MQCHGVTFDLGSARMTSTATFKTYFSCHKATWIATTDYYMYLYLIVVSPLTAILQLIN